MTTVTQTPVCNVDDKFINKLISDINCKLGKNSYRDLQNRKFGFNFLITKRNEYPKLYEYKNILERMLKCDDCLECNYNTEQILFAIKNELNGL